ncbi:hypothetical protein A2U01_0056210, partial [Trifolium medium]|nr:hypothetical protein [Trifolium medium]
FQEEIYAPEPLNADVPTLNQSFSATEQITATPYTTDDLTTPEALNEAFPVVDASNLCRDREVEPLFADYDTNTVLKDLLPSVVARVGFGQKETTVDVDNNHCSSSVMTNPGVFNLVVVLPRSETLLSDPPDLVPVPPP